MNKSMETVESLVPTEQLADNSIFEDISNLPYGKAAIVVDTVDNREKSWIFELQIDNDTLFVTQYDRGEMYSEEYYQELLVKKIPVYDLR